VVSSVDQEGDGNDVSSDIGRRLESGSVVTVRTDQVSDRKSRNPMGQRTHGIASSNCLTVKLGTMNLIVSSFSGSRGRRSSLLAVLGLLDLLFLDKSSLFGDSLPDWGRSTLSESSRHGGCRDSDRYVREENRYIEQHLVSIYDKWEG
jgi:hypothetical protein